MSRQNPHKPGHRLLAFMLALVLALGVPVASAAQPAEPDLPLHAADRFLVKFAPGARAAEVRALNARHGVQELDRIEALGVDVMSVPRGKSAQALARAYELNPNVAFAEPDYLVRASLIPNDTHYSVQWAMPKISAPPAWDTTTGSSAVTVAIVDTGVQSTHPDLAGRVVAGYDYVNHDSDPTDDHGHGTMCAGVAGANGNNGMGVAGMDWATRLLAIKVLDAGGSGYTSDVANGITYAADHGANVISMSLGASAGSSTLSNAVDYAYGRNSVLVAASGNDGTGMVSYPAAYAKVIAVGASDNSDSLASFSNWGAAQDVVAPGVQIATTGLNGSYVYYSGTSASTPFVAGLAGLAFAEDLTLTNAEVASAIYAGADDLGAAGWDERFGWGRIDAASALAIAGSPGADRVTVSSASASPNPSTVGQSVSFTASASDTLGHALSYQWTEGATVLSNARSFSTSLLTVGTHTVTVKATCSAGVYDTKTISVTVNAVPSNDRVTIWSASASPNPSTAGQSVSFSAWASDSLGHLISYQWTEGTTVLSNARWFSTSTLAVGTHAITLKATCSKGTVATKALSVTVTN